MVAQALLKAYAQVRRHLDTPTTYRLLDLSLHGLAELGRRGVLDLGGSRLPVEVRRGVAYTGSGLLAHTLDIFIPRPRPGQAQTHGRRPAVLYLHGGAFVAFSKDTHWPIGMLLAAQGYLVFNVNYRLAPAHPFPAALEDVCAAFGWVVEHLADYGGDPARLAQGASDAAFKLDGIARTSASNSIDNAAPGLSLKLTGTNVGAPTQISYSDPSAGIINAMQSLTQALNAVVGELHTARTPSPNGDLQADPGARALDRQLAALPGMVVMSGAASGAPATLSDLGLSADKNGNFNLDGTKLTKALASNRAGVAAMFTKGISGIYNTIENVVIAATAPGDPTSLNGSLSRYNARQSTLSAQQGTLATQQDKLRSQLISRFARANTNVAASNSTLAYLKNQVAAWNKSGN